MFLHKLQKKMNNRIFDEMRSITLCVEIVPLLYWSDGEIFSLPKAGKSMLKNKSLPDPVVKYKNQLKSDLGSASLFSALLEIVK